MSVTANRHVILSLGAGVQSKGECFVRSSCVPLRDIDFSKTRIERRALMSGQALLFDGGEGVCSL